MATLSSPPHSIVNLHKATRSIHSKATLSRVTPNKATPSLDRLSMSARHSFCQPSGASLEKCSAVSSMAMSRPMAIASQLRSINNLNISSLPAGWTKRHLATISTLEFSPKIRHQRSPNIRHQRSRDIHRATKPHLPPAVPSRPCRRLAARTQVHRLRLRPKRTVLRIRRRIPIHRHQVVQISTCLRRSPANHRGHALKNNLRQPCKDLA